jgi:hypothetical protein
MDQFYFLQRCDMFPNTATNLWGKTTWQHRGNSKNFPVKCQSDMNTAAVKPEYNDKYELFTHRR